MCIKILLILGSTKVASTFMLGLIDDCLYCFVSFFFKEKEKRTNIFKILRHWNFS